MKQALRSIVGLALAGFLFSSGITVFEQAYANIHGILHPAQQTLVAFK